MPISNLRYFRVFYEEKYTEWIGLYKSSPPPPEKKTIYEKYETSYQFSNTISG